MIDSAHLILYVEDQDASTRFYSAVLAQEPALHTPGMTAFHFSETCTLGLMPSAGIRRLIGDHLPDPSRALGIPRAELYLYVEDPGRYHQRALAHGAHELSPLQSRSWGDIAAYSLDMDGHVIAFAARQPSTEIKGISS